MKLVRKLLAPLHVSAALCLLLATVWLTGAFAAPAPAPKAAVFRDHLPGFDTTLAQEIAVQVGKAGYISEFIDTATLTNRAALTPDRFDLLVLPGARNLPMAAAPAVQDYLKAGGDLLALGLPAWQSPLYLVNGKWLSRQAYEKIISSQQPQHMVESFDQADLSRWIRSTGELSGKAHYELINAGSGKAFHAVIAHLGGWETMCSPSLAQPFPKQHTLTCFRAKGGPRTRQLALEWREEDGARWIATVDLTPEWQSYVLSPDRFKAWPLPVADEKRRFRPEKAVSCCVGLAMSHTALEGDNHEYWFDDLGTAPNPLGEEAPPAEANVPVLESLSPSFQCFPITTPATLHPDPLKTALESWEQPQGRTQQAGGVSLSSPGGAGRGEEASAFLALHPRPRGVGFNQQRPFRWEPLLGAYDKQEYRGAMAALLVNVEPPYRSSVWAVFTPTDAAFYCQPLVTNCLRQVLARMKRGVFLAEAGTEFFTMFEGQQFKAGARVVNLGHETVSNLTLMVKFLDAKGVSQRGVLAERFALAPGQDKVLEQDGLAKSDTEQAVSTSLSLQGAPVDALTHELGVWRPKANPRFIESRDGGFRLDGKPWKAHGINYMPSSGIGLATMRFFEGWLDRGPYDPAVIERDLRRIRAMNLNAVSVFIYHSSLSSQHLLDLLRRCEALGLHVNLSLRPGTPMNFHWKQMKELIEYYRVAQNDTVFAYDLAWEPSHGSQEEQQHTYAQRWNEWVLKRYGSISAAEKAWAFSAPQSAAIKNQKSEIEIPPMSQLTTDGPWRRLVADYRRFLDEQLQQHYDAARKLVKSIDPHHAVSFRMSCAGDPTYNWDASLPYDFAGLAEAVDIWEPEAYGRIGDWDRVRPGTFTAAYARLCDPAKPVMWAEMGFSVWDMNRMAPDPVKLAWEGNYYAHFYRMLLESGADGVCFWWYPGGFRRGENSDFGLINPDGTDRPATRVIRTQGARFLKARKPGPANYWIAVDLDRDARGLFGIFEAVQADFWKALDSGRRPALKWQHPPDASR